MFSQMDLYVHCCLPFFSFSLALLVCITNNIKATIAFNLTTLRFDESYSPLFSEFNIKRSSDDRTVSLLLNRQSGSGIITTDYYNYGFFSASIKLPAYHTAGIVVAFYTSNADLFERNHDELDIEFLGSVNDEPWRFQTNMYGNGSVSRGREERFYVDDVPIREIVRNEAMRGDFPSKPMSVYATIWDASTWATSGGRVKVDYKYQPFATDLSDLVLEGCLVDPIEQIPSTNCTDRIIRLLQQPYSTLTPDGRRAMKNFRENYMYYSYCYDNGRYPVTPPECVIEPSQKELFKENGRLRGKMASQRKRRRDQRGKPRRRKPVSRKAAIE
ncbi:hypothetical protein Leryth_010526 [Lithospermum erythrorhizon]|nr:hypothetical protein Leryth_010526 [Lithospermum erythrorhizon]